jgi:hypothetical protein
MRLSCKQEELIIDTSSGRIDAEWADGRVRQIQELKQDLNDAANGPQRAPKGQKL